MGMSEAEVRGILSKKNYEFRKLMEKHQGFEKRLEEFHKRPFLSSTEQIEVTNLKKAKLKLKDRMEQIVRDFRPEL